LLAITEDGSTIEIGTVGSLSGHSYSQRGCRKAMP